MKNNLKNIVVISLLAMHTLNFIRAHEYYERLFSGLFGSNYYGSILTSVQQVLFLLIVLLEIVLAIVFLASSGLYKDKAYKLLRYIFLMGFFLHFPYTIWFYIFNSEYLGRLELSALMLQVLFLVINIGCAVVFIMAKPQTQPAAIDLSEYELVEYTSTGHRFVHRLLDFLFLAPIYLFWQQVLPYYWDDSVFMGQLLMILIYLVYCFLSEAIFRQTLGKIATKSCVTSIGGPLTAGRVLVRTLARLIPFDNISFLFGANWHDKTTHTSVVYINTWEKVFEEPKQDDL
jgi:hypothetical protein